jgi:hypothetical protein
VINEPRYIPIKFWLSEGKVVKGAIWYFMKEVLDSHNPKKCYVYTNLTSGRTINCAHIIMHETRGEPMTLEAALAARF